MELQRESRSAMVLQHESYSTMGLQQKSRSAMVLQHESYSTMGCNKRVDLPWCCNTKVTLSWLGLQNIEV